MIILHQKLMSVKEHDIQEMLHSLNLDMIKKQL